MVEETTKVFRALMLAFPMTLEMIERKTGLKRPAVKAALNQLEKADLAYRVPRTGWYRRMLK